MYIFYLSTYITSIVIYFILINIINLKFIKSNFCCLLNDFIFYLNLLIYFVIVSTIFKASKPFFISLGICFIIVRFLLIEHFCGFFSNFFGFSAIEYESNNIFFKLMDKSDNYLTKVYSKYGPLINNINYPARGTHNNTSDNPNIFIKLFLDFVSQNKEQHVSKYFRDVLNLENVSDDINKVIYLLDKKFLISKFIWNIILITILFSLSLKYI